MGFRFTSEMFKVATAEPGVMHITELAQLAQSALDKYLSECPVVTGWLPENENIFIWGAKPSLKDTHRAVLFSVEKLEPKKCEHKPGFMTTYDASTCVNCGVKLTATWKAEGE